MKECLVLYIGIVKMVFPVFLCLPVLGRWEDREGAL